MIVRKREERKGEENKKGDAFLPPCAKNKYRELVASIASKYFELINALQLGEIVQKIILFL